MATSGDDDVIENMNASGEGDEAVELNDVPEVKSDSKEINGVNGHSNTDGNGVLGKQGIGSKPNLHKIFIALLVVLLIAVIALSFILYHLDQEVDDTDNKAEAAKQTIKDSGVLNLKKLIKELQNKTVKMEIKMKEFQGRKDLSKNMTKLSREQNELSINQTKYNDLLSALEAKVKKDVSQLRNEDAKFNQIMKKINESQLTEMKKLKKLTQSKNRTDQDLKVLIEDVVHLREKVAGMLNNITSLENVVDNSLVDISNVKAQTGNINKTMHNNTEGITKLNEFLDQVHLHMQYNSKGYGDFNLTFKDILKLIGKDDKVEKESQLLESLESQVKEFRIHNAEWRIQYKDVIRLTDVTQLKGEKNLTTVKKLASLFKIFKDKYISNWKIEFKDVIRLTTREDVKGIILQDNPKTPLILQRIDHLFTTFNQSYEHKWRVEFKDIVDLTKTIDFDVFEMVSSWYVENFADIWGNGTFKDFFKIMKDNPKNRGSLLKKITAVSKKDDFLKFLPATWEMTATSEGDDLSVYGYIELCINNLWGTVRGVNPAAAKVICKQGGYTAGEYDKWKYHVGTVNRTSMRCLISDLYCYGTEATVTKSKCQYKNSTVWDHKEDVGIKCTF